MELHRYSLLLKTLFKKKKGISIGVQGYRYYFQKAVKNNTDRQ